MEDMPKFRKIKALVPEELFELLKTHNKFNNEWDSWISKIIIKTLKEEHLYVEEEVEK